MYHSMQWHFFPFLWQSSILPYVCMILYFVVISLEFAHGADKSEADVFTRGKLREDREFCSVLTQYSAEWDACCLSQSRDRGHRKMGQ